MAVSLWIELWDRATHWRIFKSDGITNKAPSLPLHSAIARTLSPKIKSISRCHPAESSTKRRVETNLLDYFFSFYVRPDVGNSRSYPSYTICGQECAVSLHMKGILVSVVGHIWPIHIPKDKYSIVSGKTAESSIKFRRSTYSSPLCI